MIPPALWLVGAGCLPHPNDDALIDQLDREVRALKVEQRVLEERLQTCDQGDSPNALFAELVQVFAGTEVTVSRAGARSVVVMPGELLFSPNSTVIRAEAAMVVDLLATALQLHAEDQIWIVGHTDDSPLSSALRKRFASSWELSAARAAALMQALIDTYHLAPQRFTIAGRGSVDPVADNDTPQGRAQNRRIVVVIGPPDSYR